MNDSADIKEHPFFKDLNWEDVYSGKIRNPPIEIMDINPESTLEVSFEKKKRKRSSDNKSVASESITQPQEKLKEWTFIR